VGRARSCPAPATRRWLRVGEGGPRGGAFPQERPTWRSANTQVAGAAGAASIPRSGDNTSNTAPIRPGEAGRVSEGRRRHLPRCGCQAGDLRPMPLQRAASVIGARAGSLPTCFRPCAPSAQRRPHPRARPAAPGGPLSVRRRTAGMRPDRQRRTAVKSDRRRFQHVDPPDSSATVVISAIAAAAAIGSASSARGSTTVQWGWAHVGGFSGTPATANSRNVVSVTKRRRRGHPGRDSSQRAVRRLLQTLSTLDWSVPLPTPRV